MSIFTFTGLTAMILSFAITHVSKHTGRDGRLDGKRIAILATDGFEHSELVQPRKALHDAGAQTVLVSLEPGKIKSWKDGNWGESIPVDLELAKAKAEEFDGLLLPGGVMNPDKLRMNPTAVQFVKSFWDAGKPVAAICHGPWMLVEADIVRGRQVTSWPSLKKDIQNAGGNWIDMAVVEDKGMITSRKPDDIPAFNAKIIEIYAQSASRKPARTSVGNR